MPQLARLQDFPRIDATTVGRSLTCPFTVISIQAMECSFILLSGGRLGQGDQGRGFARHLIAGDAHFEQPDSEGSRRFSDLHRLGLLRAQNFVKVKPENDNGVAALTGHAVWYCTKLTHPRRTEDVISTSLDFALRPDRCDSVKLQLVFIINCRRAIAGPDALIGPGSPPAQDAKLTSITMFPLFACAREGSHRAVLVGDGLTGSFARDDGSAMGRDADPATCAIALF